MLARLILPVALTALVLALGALWWQSGTMGRLQLDNVRLARSVALLEQARQQARLAADVARATADRERRRIRHLARDPAERRRRCSAA